MLVEPATRTVVDFDPLIEEWFATRFSGPTAPQIAGWPRIQTGDDVLITAPTGSGKTLAAFLVAWTGWCARRAAAWKRARRSCMFRRSKRWATTCTRTSRCRWRRSASLPRGAASRLRRFALRPAHRRHDRTRPRAHACASRRTSWSPRPSRCTFCSPRSARAKPCARYRTVIVDEIHAMVDDKRGSHLALSLARLDARRRKRRREAAAHRAIGDGEADRRGRAFLEPRGAHRRTSATGARWTLRVEVPRDELGPVASSEMWAEIYDRLGGAHPEQRTTLVFVNTRRLSERVAHASGRAAGRGHRCCRITAAWRATSRLDAERRLKNGELRAVVATASLELGIDIGSVDLVVQIGSPRSIARRAAAHRALRPLGGREAARASLRHHARRADRMRGAGARDPHRRAGPA